MRLRPPGSAASENRSSDAVPAGPPRALVIGDDIGVFLSVARSLGRAGIRVDVATCGEDYPGLRSRHVSEVRVLPPYLFARKDWLDRLEILIERELYRLVLPSSDSSLDLLCAAEERMGRGRFTIPNPAARDAFCDKAATRALAASLGVSMAAGRACIAGTATLSLLSGQPFPFVIKPARSFAPDRPEAKRAVWIVKSAAQLREAMAALEGQRIVVEEFFAGEGVGVSVIARDGAVQSVWQHRRMAETSEAGRSSRRKGEPPDPRLLRHVEALAAATRLTGVAMFEFRQDRASGEHILVEVNPRFWGSLPLAIAAGADFPLRLWEQSTGGSGRELPLSFDARLRKIDLSGEVQRLTATPGFSTGELRAVMALLALLVHAAILPRDFDGWAKDDPAPHWAELKDLLMHAMRAVTLRAKGRVPKPPRGTRMRA